MKGDVDTQFAKTYQATIALGMAENNHSKNMKSDGTIDYNGSAWKKFKDATISSSTYTDERLNSMYMSTMVKNMR